jgi:hypothetical protein
MNTATNTDMYMDADTDMDMVTDKDRTQIMTFKISSYFSIVGPPNLVIIFLLSIACCKYSKLECC